MLAEGSFKVQLLRRYPAPEGVEASFVQSLCHSLSIFTCGEATYRSMDRDSLPSSFLRVLVS